MLLKHFYNSQSARNQTLHCKEISIYVFPEKELLGLSPNFHIHVSVSDLSIPTIGPPPPPIFSLYSDNGPSYSFLLVVLLSQLRTEFCLYNYSQGLGLEPNNFIAKSLLLFYI
jgi:hypothetical protein